MVYYKVEKHAMIIINLTNEQFNFLPRKSILKSSVGGTDDVYCNRFDEILGMYLEDEFNDNPNPTNLELADWITSGESGNSCRIHVIWEGELREMDFF
jgi:hypothetical protein